MGYSYSCVHIEGVARCIMNKDFKRQMFVPESIRLQTVHTDLYSI